MNKIYFAICLHFHQPVGNFDNIIERAYQNCYKPFLDIFEKYPDIKMSFHFSGCLLDYLEEKHPDYLDRIVVMVKRGQVEMFGGGYYEPIFTSIPEKDRTGQIEMMSGYLKKKFGRKPDGMWIPERVWIPGLIPCFTKSKIKYSILDDEHFIKAGLKTEDLHGYFSAIYKNDEMAIFPSSKQLRYMIPFKMPHETINYFKSVGAINDRPILTYGDDAEKFGEWPGTYDWVYKSEWLKKFLDELSKNKDWLETITFKEAVSLAKPRKKVNIPEASYQEMMEWSGGSWMNFLKKYPETNQMVKKMHYVSKKVNSTGDALALRELYKGQCNCSYWHGVFGGLYLYHLRKAIYEHLINAEKIADKILHKGKKDWAEIKETDFYENNKKALILENEEVSLCVDPESGAIIRELDVKKVSTNVVNSIARHEEEYHKKILAKMGKSNDVGAVRTIHEDAKSIDPALNSEFCYDNYIRGCLVDHFIDVSSSIDSFMNCKSEELGDFVNAVYKAKKEKGKAIFTRKGKVSGNGLAITKEIQLKGKKEIEVSYGLKNLSKNAISAIFGVEFNLTMPYLNSDKYNYFGCDRILNNLNEKGSISDTGAFSIKDSGKEPDINFTFSKKPESIWYFPVKTVSQSERAYELNFQASCVIPRWQINIPSAKELNFNIILSF